MSKLYALLVGINDYQSSVRKLKGCIQDIQNISSYISSELKDNFELEIKTLKDQNATYSNIIDGFENHLCHAGSDDVVWFHFSGHGTEERSAPQFLTFDSTGKDQCLVCYNGNKKENYLLADKELAALTERVANSYPNGTQKANSPHILVSLDCCHSGSGTRDLEKSEYSNVRSARSSGEVKGLQSYYKGYYANQGGDISIPSVTHINLSACERHEEAGDTSNGGAFTSGLIKALKNSKGSLSYSDLYLRTRTAVRKIRSHQHPKFTFIGEANPTSRFLSDQSLGKPNSYEVYFSKGRWRMKFGLIHGFNKDFKNEVLVDILDSKSKTVGSAKVLSVGVLESLLEINFGFSLRTTFSSLFGRTPFYKGQIKSLPVKQETISIQGNEAEFQSFNSKWRSAENILVSTNGDDEDRISVSIGNGQYDINDLVIGKTVFKAGEILPVSDSIHKMVRWYRFLELQNNDPLSRILNQIDFKLHLENPSSSTFTQDGFTEIVKAKLKHNKGEKLGIMPKVYIKDNSRDYFMYLFYLDEDYSITCPEEEMIFRGDGDGDGVSDIDEKYGADGVANTGDETDATNSSSLNKDQISFVQKDFEGKGLEINLWKQSKGLIPDSTEKELNVFFKLVVTSESLDYFQFIQDGLGTFRSGNDRQPTLNVPNDWACININLKLKLI